MASARRLGRPLRLLALHARMELVLLLSSGSGFLLWGVSQVLARGGTVTGVLLLAHRFDGIGGWSEAEVVFLLAYGLTVAGLETAFFSYNVNAISRRVGRGQLDHTLLQPRSLLLSFATEGFAPLEASTLLLPGVALMALSLDAAGIPLTLSLAARVLLSLAASTVVLLSFSFLWGSLAFWAPRGAEEISPAATDLLQTLKMFPLDVAGPALRWLLATIVPAAFMAWLPSRALLGRGGGTLATIAAAAVAAGAATLFFRRGLRHYARTGSQRYSTFGHRR